MKKLTWETVHMLAGSTEKLAVEVPICRDCTQNPAGRSGFKPPKMYLDHFYIHNVHKEFRRAFEDLNSGSR